MVKLFSSAGEGGNSLPSFRPFRRDAQADGCPMAEKDCGHSHVHGMKAASLWGGAAYGRKRGSPVSIFQRGSVEKQRAEIRAITKWSFHFHLLGNLILVSSPSSAWWEDELPVTESLWRQSRPFQEHRWCQRTGPSLSPPSPTPPQPNKITGLEDKHIFSFIR